jgi:two-component system sensor histidine kinase DegS
LSTGDTLALQLGFCDAVALTPDERDKVTKLSLPVLMWAKHALDTHALEARLAALEERSRADVALAIKAQEEEREWLAYEVHDRVAQTLASVFQQLQAMESLAQSLPEIRQVAVRGSVLLREAIREARDIMNELQPPVLADLGLIPLIEEELRHLEEETHCRARAALTCRVRPPREIEVGIYRILHEGLTNIRRHAKAKEVAVSLHCSHDGARLEVEDNGVGFDVAEVLPKKRVGGLLSMQRRAEIMGGACRLESQPGKGTRVSAWIPWKARANQGSGGTSGK